MKLSFRSNKYDPRLLRAFSICAVLLIGATPWQAAAEAPGNARADSLLGAQARGPNYTVVQEVRSDGLMHLYTLRTSYGVFEVTGDALLRQRLRELAAMRRLEAISESETFTRSFGRAAAAPVRFGADLVNDPSATLQRTASGIGNMFDRAGAAISNRGASRGDPASALLGVETARRSLAHELGVDPYTDFPPLAARMNDVARAAAGGGIAVKALTMAVPGGAGMLISAGSTGDKANELLRDQTSAQIIARVRDMLGGMGVPSALARQLVENRQYTPTDLLYLASGLAAARQRNTQVFIARAAEASDREEAYFQRLRAQMIATHAARLGLVEFVSIGDFPLNRTRDGKTVALFPLDQVSWTPTVERAFQAATEDMRARNVAAGAILGVPGTLSPAAQQEIGKLGWSIQKLP